MEALQAWVGQTIRFQYNGAQRTIAVEKVHESSIKGTKLVTGKDVDKGEYRSFNIVNIHSWEYV